jgi:transmembrane sensor
MSHESERIAERAAEYLARSREETPAQRQEREDWLAADPRHRELYLQLQRLDERASVLLQDPDVRDRTGRDTDDLPRTPSAFRRWLWIAVIALLLLLVALLAARSSGA